jgi:hypothetical protein
MTTLGSQQENIEAPGLPSILQFKSFCQSPLAASPTTEMLRPGGPFWQTLVMAWRIHESVVRGDIDNRVKGQIRGQIWVEGRDEPLTLLDRITRMHRMRSRICLSVIL